MTVCLSVSSLQNPATITRILLSHFNWDKEKLMERWDSPNRVIPPLTGGSACLTRFSSFICPTICRYFDGNLDKLFSECHVINPSKKPRIRPPINTRSSAQDIPCQICYLNFPNSVSLAWYRVALGECLSWHVNSDATSGQNSILHLMTNTDASNRVTIIIGAGSYHRLKTHLKLHRRGHPKHHYSQWRFNPFTLPLPLFIFLSKANPAFINMILLCWNTPCTGHPSMFRVSKWP